MSNFSKSILYSTTVLAVGLIAIFAIYDVVSTQKSSTGVAAIEPASGEGSSTAGIDADAMSNSLNDIRESAGNKLKEAKDDVAEIKDALENVGNQNIVKTDSLTESTSGVSDAELEATVEATEEKVETIEPAAGALTESITEKGDAVIENAEDVSEDISNTIEESAETLPEINIHN